MSQHSCQLDGLGNREDGDACGLGADMGCWSCRLAGPKLCGTALWRIGTVMTAEQTASATLGTLSVDTGRDRSRSVVCFLCWLPGADVEKKRKLRLDSYAKPLLIEAFQCPRQNFSLTGGFAPSRLSYRCRQ